MGDSLNMESLENGRIEISRRDAPRLNIISATLKSTPIRKKDAIFLFARELISCKFKDLKALKTVKK